LLEPAGDDDDLVGPRNGALGPDCIVLVPRLSGAFDLSDEREGALNLRTVTLQNGKR
jgi:hypothetical protein